MELKSAGPVSEGANRRVEIVSMSPRNDEEPAKSAALSDMLNSSDRFWLVVGCWRCTGGGQPMATEKGVADLGEMPASG